MDQAIELVRQCGFWFVDIPRTSSSSLRYELGLQFGMPYGKVNVIEQQFSSAQLFKDHMTADQMCSIFGREIWDELFTFTLVRNPFDRIYSMYNYRKKIGKLNNWSFREYVMALEKADQNTPFFKYHAHRYGSADYVFDKQGNVMVDFIGRYENREKDLALIAAKIGINQLGKVQVQKASPENTHYTEFYDSQMKDIIYKRYRQDFERFSYEF